MKFGRILWRVQHTQCLSFTAYNSSDHTRDRTTHFGFETVTEAEKGKKGLLFFNYIQLNLAPKLHLCASLSWLQCMITSLHIIIIINLRCGFYLMLTCDILHARSSRPLAAAVCLMAVITITIFPELYGMR